MEYKEKNVFDPKTYIFGLKTNVYDPRTYVLVCF